MSVPAIHFYDTHPGQASFLNELVQGLRQRPRRISPKFFYDQHGSELFDAICEQPEYYPTRTEVAILQAHADDIAARIGSRCLLVELGSGASKKVRLLLSALKPEGYMGVDISREFLLDSTRRLAADYPWLEVHATCADFSQRLELPDSCRGRRKVAFFPGSSIGNFEPVAAVRFLDQLAGMLGSGGLLLIGVDLKKSPAILEAAYNDAAGVTEAFNRNLLVRMQRELGADLDVDGFAHHAYYNEAAGRVEMHLVSRGRQRIGLNGQVFELADGESIHTESSYKYQPDEFAALAARGGFSRRALWTDPQQRFSVQLFEVR